VCSPRPRTTAFRLLASQHDLIVIEGAGSPAEINLAEHDYVNLGVARWARQQGPTAALLVTDIDRGGAFAHVHGTWSLLPEDVRGLLAGYVLNRFRGDAALLAPGPRLLQESTGLPLAGVVPMRRDHGLPEEDGWLQLAQSAPAESAESEESAGGVLQVAVVAPPHISNLDEFQPLTRVPGLRLTWVRRLEELQGADWIVLPGSKQTSGDLEWLRSRGLESAIRQHAALGKPVLGICGGLQMLGRTLSDPHGCDGAEIHDMPGLGLLPLSTHFESQKYLSRGEVRFCDQAASAWAALCGVRAEAYEIRCGQTAADTGSAVLFDGAGQAIGWQAGSVLGVYAHGLFESAAVIRALFGARVPTLEDSFELLADMAQTHLDPALLRRLFYGQ
jgi:adenosylcobyric acid synthase